MQMIQFYSINLSVSAYKIIWGWIGKVCIKYSCLLIIFSVLLTVEKLMSVVSELDIWEILVLQFFVLSKIFMNEVIVMGCKENASKFFTVIIWWNYQAVTGDVHYLRKLCTCSTDCYIKHLLS